MRSQHALVTSLSMVLIMALIWGSNFPIAKQAIAIIGPWAFRAYCALVSVLCLLIIFFGEVRKNWVTLSLSEHAKMFIIAVPNIFMVPTLNNIALNHTTVSNATFLIYTMPCFTSFILMILDRKLEWLSIISMGLCLVGILLVLNIVNIGYGELVIMSSAMIWAVGAVLSQRIQCHTAFKAKLCWQMIYSMVLVFVLANVIAPGEITGKISTALANSTTLFAILYTGVIGSALVYYIWFSLIKIHNAEYASYATLLSPIVTLSIAILFLNETPGRDGLLGFGLILSSAMLVTIIKPLLRNRPGLRKS